MKQRKKGTFLMVQWLRLRVHTARGPGLIPGWELKIPHVAMKILCAATKTKNSQINIYTFNFFFKKEDDGLDFPKMHQE